jgi:hypothetical protein
MYFFFILETGGNLYQKKGLREFEITIFFIVDNDIMYRVVNIHVNNVATWEVLLKGINPH